MADGPENGVLSVSEAEPAAAVCGKPIAHSLSPVIHNAGYAAAGLFDWSYTAIECAEAELAALVAGLGPEWAGLSLTMPLKEVALAVADEASPVAAALGAANTLVRDADGTGTPTTPTPRAWSRVLATPGVTGGRASPCSVPVAPPAPRWPPPPSSARPRVTVVTRRPEAADELRPAAEALGLPLTAVAGTTRAGAFDDDMVVSTVPKGVADPLAAPSWRPGTVLFDAVYDPWPTPLAAAAAARGVPGRLRAGPAAGPGARPVRAVHRRTPAPVRRCGAP